MKKAMKRLLVTVLVLSLAAMLPIGAAAEDANDWVKGMPSGMSVTDFEADDDGVTIDLDGYVDPTQSYTASWTTQMKDDFKEVFSGNKATGEFTFIALDAAKIVEAVGAEAEDEIAIVQFNNALAELYPDAYGDGVKAQTYVVGTDIATDSDPYFYLALLEHEDVAVAVLGEEADDLDDAFMIEITSYITFTPPQVNTDPPRSSSGGQVAYSSGSDEPTRAPATISAPAGTPAGESPTGTAENPATYAPTAEGGGSIAIKTNVAPWMFLEGRLDGPAGFDAQTLNFGKGVSAVDGQIVISPEVLATLPKGTYTFRMTYANHVIDYYFTVA